MGCDIHLGIEVKNDHGWEPLRWPNRWHRADNPDPDETPQTPRFDFGRNYDAFAILANVRNGYGFAGCDTGDGFVPIAEPRGFPEDAHPETLEHACTGDHTPTYVMADELLAYDWTRSSKHRGWINGPTFEEWDRRREWQPRPSDWCGGISGQAVDHVSEQEMRRKVKEIMGDVCYGAGRAARLERLKARLGSTYCLVEWEEPYTEAAGELWTRVMPLVMKLKAEGKEARLVMNFDS